MVAKYPEFQASVAKAPLKPPSCEGRVLVGAFFQSLIVSARAMHADAALDDLSMEVSRTTAISFGDFAPNLRDSREERSINE